jgi:hypothetical protein
MDEQLQALQQNLEAGAPHDTMVEIEKNIATAKKNHDDFLQQLGLPLLV